MSTSVVSQKIQEMRESVTDLSAAETETINGSTLEVNDVVRQGDIYLTCLESMPEGGKPSLDMQLAPGTTQGSRHILVGKVELFTGVSMNGVDAVLTGPAFKCETATKVTHPEHGDKILPAGSLWQVTYQQAYADQVRRVQD